MVNQSTAQNQSSSPASSVGGEGSQSVSPASEQGTEGTQSVPFRGGGGGGGSNASSNARLREVARQARLEEARRKLQAEQQARAKARREAAEKLRLTRERASQQRRQDQAERQREFLQSRVGGRQRTRTNLDKQRERQRLIDQRNREIRELVKASAEARKKSLTRKEVRRLVKKAETKGVKIDRTGGTGTFVKSARSFTNQKEALKVNQGLENAKRELAFRIAITETPAEKRRLLRFIDQIENARFRRGVTRVTNRSLTTSNNLLNKAKSFKTKVDTRLSEGEKRQLAKNRKNFKDLSKAEQDRILKSVDKKGFNIFVESSKVSSKAITPLVSKFEKSTGVELRPFLKKKLTPKQVDALGKELFFLPGFVGSFGKQGQALIRQAAIKEGTKNPNIVFKSIIKQGSKGTTTGTVAVSKVLDKRITSLIKTRSVGKKISVGKSISVVKTKKGFQFFDDTLISKTKRLKGKASKVKKVRVKRRVLTRGGKRVSGSLKVNKLLKDADLFSSINLEKELANKALRLKNKKLTVIPGVKAKFGKTQLTKSSVKKTPLFATVQRKGNKLLIRAGKAEAKRLKFSKVLSRTQGRFKTTIKGTAKVVKEKGKKTLVKARPKKDPTLFVDLSNEKVLVGKVSNKLRRQRLVKLKKSIEQAGANIPQAVLTTQKKVTAKVFKEELGKLKTIVKQSKFRGAVVGRGIKSTAPSSRVTSTSAKLLQKPAQRQSVAQGQRAKQVLRVAAKTRQKARQVPAAKQLTAQRAKSKQRATTVTRLKLKTLKAKKSRSVRTPGTPRFPKPFKVPPPLFLFLLKKGVLKRKKKQKKSEKDSFVLVEGFTAKALRLKPVKIKPSQVKKFVKKFQTIGVRRRPVFVKETTKKKTKRKAKSNSVNLTTKARKKRR